MATPGRILDLMNKNLVKIGKCGILVLDEVWGNLPKEFLHSVWLVKI